MTLQRLEDLLETAYRTGTAADWAAYQAAHLTDLTETAMGSGDPSDWAAFLVAAGEAADAATKQEGTG